jgi:hypothetical protein
MRGLETRIFAVEMKSLQSLAFIFTFERSGSKPFARSGHLSESLDRLSEHVDGRLPSSDVYLDEFDVAPGFEEVLSKLLAFRLVEVSDDFCRIFILRKGYHKYHSKS